MKELTVRIRNWKIGWLYRHLLKPIFFRHDPEDIHNLLLRRGTMLGRHSFTRSATRAAFGYHNQVLEQNVNGIHFTNPVGLSAGFDKNAVLTNIIPSVGFGFMEVGSITGQASPGNPKPRLWRYPEEQSILVHFGLNNDGVDAVAEKLEQKKFRIPVGTNIAMTNRPEKFGVEEGIADYVKSFTRLSNIGSFFTINISCPNTYQGQPFSDPVVLDKLFSALDAVPTTKPLFLKLSPDLLEHEVDAILEVVQTHRLHGFVCSNLTQKHSKDHPGGLSGKVQQGLSEQQLAHVYKRAGGNYTIIGVGGIFSAEDAYRKIKLGASLVELITGMIYQGPSLISTINQGLVRLLKKDGFDSLRKAVGVVST